MAGSFCATSCRDTLFYILIVSKFNLDRCFNILREKRLVKDSGRMRNYILNFDSYFFSKTRIKF